MSKSNTRTNDEVIEWRSNDLLGHTGISELIDKFARALSGRVISAYVFGSLARSEARFSSDVDLMLVVDTEKKFLRRADDFFDLWEIAPDLDLLVYTPSEFKALSQNPTKGFWASVQSEMKQII